jgi:formylglycine-generating enzyme required for sulfatase activity
VIHIGAGKIILKNEASGFRWIASVQPFAISPFIVTNEQYQLFNPNLSVNQVDKQKPVVEVSWLDAIAYCNFLSEKSGLTSCYSSNSTGLVVCDWTANGYRLPTEAEWELACRAGSTAIRYGDLNDIAWYEENSDSRLHEVGTKKPNDYGLYDTIGNVWEWCWDIFDAKVYGDYRVFRGGGWSDPARSCRASCRRKSHPTFRVDDLGFRLAQTI